MKNSQIGSFLQTLEADQLNQLDADFHQLVKAVEKTGKPGSFTLKLKITKTSATQSLITVEAIAKAPKGLAPIKSLYFCFDDLNQPTGELSTHATRQPDLFETERSGPAPLRSIKP